MMMSCNVVSRVRPTRAFMPRRAARHVLPVRAANEQKNPLANLADSIGLPTDEGVFGFKPFAEVWTGRLAMIGFVSSFAVELATGKATLQQIGIETPSGGLLAAMVGLVVVGSAVGAGFEAYRAFGGKMTKKEKKRYQQFLLLDKEDEMIKETRAEGTLADKFLKPENNWDEIKDTRAAGMPADKVLANNSGDEGQGAVAVAVREYTEPKAAPPQPKSYDDIVFNNDELKYARGVELSNGRAAMIGFLAAILVEAATGKGIISQLIMWFKFMGLLGAESGF